MNNSIIIESIKIFYFIEMNSNVWLYTTIQVIQISLSVDDFPIVFLEFFILQTYLTLYLFIRWLILLVLINYNFLHNINHITQNTKYDFENCIETSKIYRNSSTSKCISNFLYYFFRHNSIPKLHYKCTGNSFWISL